MSKKPSYTALDPTKQEIRLLRVHPGSPRDTTDILQCELFVADLNDEKLQYDALSYCWGDPRPQKTIIVSGREVEVGPSLESGLRHLRYPDRDLVIWADAICIHQKNHQEKNHQVGQMSRVYQKAQTVRVWLGKAQFDAPISYELLECFREFTTIGVTDNTPVSDAQTCEYFNRFMDLASAPSMAIVKDFVLSKYWTRTWIFQEIALANRAVFHYGHHQISLHDLLYWKDEIRAISHLNFFGDREYAKTVDAAAPSGADFLHTAFCMDNILQLLEYLRVNSSDTGSLFKIAKSLHHHEASDPRDKIFGIAGLAKQKSPSTDVLMKPDYDKDLMTVWTDFARYVAEDESAFGLLSLSGGARDGNEQAAKTELPSWVPDWKQLSQIKPKQVSFEGTEPVVEVLYADCTSLRVRGRMIGKVARTIPRSPRLGTTQLYPYNDLAENLPALIDGNVDSLVDRGRRQTLLHLLVETQRSSGAKSPELKLAKAVRSTLLLFSDDASVEKNTNLVKSSTSSESMSDLLFEQNIAKAMHDISLYLKQTLLPAGWSTDIQLGDHVFCLAPDDAVVVLRPQSDKGEEKPWYRNAGIVTLPSWGTMKPGTSPFDEGTDTSWRLDRCERHSDDSREAVDDDEEHREYVDIEIR